MTTLTKHNGTRQTGGRLQAGSTGSPRRGITHRMGDLRIATGLHLPGHDRIRLLPDPHDPRRVPELHGVQHPRRPDLDRDRELHGDFRRGPAVLECPGVTSQYVVTQHRPPDRHCPWPGPADAPGREVHAHPRRAAAAVPDGKCHRRPALVLDARLPDRHRQPVHRVGWAAPRRVLRQRAVGHPHHRPDQRLAAHGLHGPADLRRPADHPQPRLRGRQPGRRLTVPDFRSHHPAAAAPGPGPGPGGHRDRLLPGLRHRGRHHRTAARSTPPASSSTTSTSAPSPSRTSATPPHSPSFSSSSSPWSPSSR